MAKFAKKPKAPWLAWVVIVVLVLVLLSRHKAKVSNTVPVDSGVYAGPDINPQTGASTWTPDSNQYTGVGSLYYNGAAA